MDCTRQASLSITNSQSPPKPMSIELVMPSNHLILCRHLLLLPSIFPSIRVFSMSRLLASGGQSVGASASASLPLMSIQDWFPSGLTHLTSLLLLTHTLSSLSRSLQVVMHSLWQLGTEFAFKSTTVLSGFQASLKSDSRPSVSLGVHLAALTERKTLKHILKLLLLSLVKYLFQNLELCHRPFSEIYLTWH